MMGVNQGLRLRRSIINTRKIKQKRSQHFETSCSPYEIRTRITTVKGWCPNP